MSDAPGSAPGSAPPYTEIGYDVADGVATVTLNRPARLNAFTPTMCAELVRACDEVDADDAVRVLVVTGAGRAFCAGADLARGGETFAGRDRGSDAGGSGGAGGAGDVPRDLGAVATLRVAALRKPVIAAINGPAVGVGATLTLPMDVRLAARSARIGFVFARRGIPPDGASSWFLPRVVGIGQAMEWVATGRVFDADEAHAGRLVSRVVPDGDLLPAATALAREIADNTSAVAVAAARHLLWGMTCAADPWEAHRHESRALHAFGSAPDAAEGVMSFLEKRPPRFTMRVSTDLPDVVPLWPPSPPDGG